MNKYSLEQIRAQFPHIEENVVYFNHASIGPINKFTADVITDYIEERSRRKIKNYDRTVECDISAKMKLGKLLNANPNRISWISNVSDAFNILCYSVSWSPGDEIILNDIEFPSNVYPFLKLQEKGVIIKFAKSVNGVINFDSITNLVNGKTKLISISAVQFTSGYKANLKKLGEFCKDRNILFSVDGIQGVGAVKIDFEEFNIDFLAGGTHKWLMSLQGLSYFVISDKLFELMDPPFLGWLSVQTAWELLNYDTKLKDNAERFSTGTINSLGIVAFNASIDLWFNFGLTNVYSKVIENTNYLRKSLLSMGYNFLCNEVLEENYSGIVSIKHNRNEYFHKALEKEKIFVELREGFLRISPHFYNTKEEINKLLNVLD